MCRPRPSCHTPTDAAFSQDECKDGSRLFEGFAFLLERQIHGNDNIGAIRCNIDVAGLQYGGHQAGDFGLLEEGVEVILPPGAGSRALPLVWWEVIDNGCFVSASGIHSL